MPGFLQSALGQNNTYTPYSGTNPMGTLSFNNGGFNQTLGPQQQQFNTLFGTQVGNNFSNGSMNYNPNTSFLPGQYQSIYGNMDNNVNSMYNSLNQAQMPYWQQYMQSNLDNEFSKGTLASTAGGYQTMGANQALLNQQNTNMAQAQQYALGRANSQFGAAQGTAGLGEQQSEFGPSFATGQTNSLFGNTLNQGSLLNNTLGLGLQGGYEQGMVNKTPSVQQQGSAGLLNGLLFGNGSGGLINSLFGSGTSGGVGGLAGFGNTIGKGLGSLFGLGGGSGDGTGLSTDESQGGGLVTGLGGSTDNVDFGQGGDTGSYDVGNPQTVDGLYGGNSDVSPDGIDSSNVTGPGLDMGNLDMGFPSAGGQAADQALEDMTNNAQMPTDINYGSSGTTNSFGGLNSAYGAYQGLTSGNPVGEAGGALDAAKAYGSLTGNAGVSAGAGAGLGALGIYSGLERGGVTGDTQAALGSAQLAGQAANAGYLGSSGAASTLGAVGSTAAAVAPLVGLALYAAQTPAYTLGPQYYNRVNQDYNSTVSGGINATNQFGQGTFMSNYDELMNAAQSGSGPNAPALNGQQQSTLKDMFNQYIAQNMPWINSEPQGPLGPPARKGGGGKGSYLTENS